MRRLSRESAEQGEGFLEVDRCALEAATDYGTELLQKGAGGTRGADVMTTSAHARVQRKGGMVGNSMGVFFSLVFFWSEAGWGGTRGPFEWID